MSKFSKETQENFDKWDKIYNLTEYLKYSERFVELNEYLQEFNNDDTDHGTLRTVLIAVKSVKNNPICKETFDQLADRLKKKLGVEKI